MLDVRGLGMPSDEVRALLLHDAGVVVIHGSAYGPGGEGTLRVSFAAGGERWNADWNGCAKGCATALTRAG